MKDVKILKLKDADKNTYSDIKELLLDLYPKNAPLTYSEFEAVIKRKGVSVFIAVEEKKVVGTGSLAAYSKLGGKVSVIEDVVVDKKCRGNGIGKSLTNAMIAEAKMLGGHFVDVNTRRADAKEFYIRCGFSEKNKERNFFALRYEF